MDCNICHRGHDARRLPFLCAVDARNQVYEGRMKTVQLLLENDTLQQQIQDVVGDESKPSLVALDLARSKKLLAEDETGRILAAAGKLRDDIKAAHDEIKARKAALERRKSDLASVSEGLSDRRAKQQKEVSKTSQGLQKRWSTDAEYLSRTRAFLCLEAARLYGLKRTKGSNGRYTYHLGKIPVVDLASMNCTLPVLSNSSFSNFRY